MNNLCVSSKHLKHHTIPHSDITFKSIQDKWEDGQELDWTDLIDRASKKYKSLREAGKWKDKNSQRQKIDALTASFKEALKTTSRTPHPPYPGKNKGPKPKGDHLKE